MTFDKHLILKSHHADAVAALLNRKHNKRAFIDYEYFQCLSSLCKFIPHEPIFWRKRNIIIQRMFRNFSKLEFHTLETVYSKILSTHTKSSVTKYNDLYKLELSYLKEVISIENNNFAAWDGMDLLYDLYSPIIIDYEFLQSLLAHDEHLIFVWNFISKHIRKTSNYKKGLEISKRVIKKNKNNSSAWNLRYNIISRYEHKRRILDELKMLLEFIDNSNCEAIINYIFAFSYMREFEYIIGNIKFVDNEYLLLKLISYGEKLKSRKSLHRYIEMLKKTVNPETLQGLYIGELIKCLEQ